MSKSTEDQIKEAIKFNTELIRLLTVAILTTGGGISTLAIKENVNWKVDFLVIFGSILLCIFALGLVTLVIRNLRKIKELR